MLHNIYFSARGTTRTCAEWIGKGLDMEMVSYDWLRQPCTEPMKISGDDVLLFSMPVYGGYIPKLCKDMAVNLEGNHTPAIIAAVYGNRHYDNALLQMKDILTDRGFRVIAAGAFLAEHSIFPMVAAGRPDEKDKEAMTEFAKRCSRILAEKDFEAYGGLQVPGTPGYDDTYKGVGWKPDGDDTCIGCGTCVTVCLKNAVNPDDPKKTDTELCISCGACIYNCPVGARNHHKEGYQEAGLQFAKRCSEYRMPEAYYITGNPEL